ncbi:MAG: nucleoside deaminase [Candidatus Eremiobacteraeota bacterium]|nr:nucleoside deaminase [Candidatus Eremiobacteraeota bacterium]MCW5872112.1 nucleoside deaminase [Candidatus Eremiobacteraeota bacterium]
MMRIVVEMPAWIEEEMARRPSVYTDLADRIRLVVEFSRLNVEHDTGGPFAAAVFEEATGKLVSIGVNRVVPTCVSSAHAEFTALALAQQKLGTFDLGGAGMPAHQLVVNWRPCTMCFGAVIWSGVRSLVLAGSGVAVEEITGFDEGPMMDNWIEELNRRGISVLDDQNREAALEVFRYFRDSAKIVYNARRG